MRGITIQAPLEFRLEVPGDSFEQGAQVPCSLTIKNHSETVVTVDTPTILLTEGNLKKVRAKDDSAFGSVVSAELERGVEVGPKAEARFESTFCLDKNNAITDKAQSPYLLYGNGTAPASLGQLPLTVTPHPHIRSIFDSLTTVFSFVNKGETSKSGWTSVKLKAPDSRRFSTVDELNLSCRFDGEALELSYVFSVKKFEGVAVMMEVRKGKMEITQRWEPSEYLFGQGFVRQEFVEKSVEEALSAVATTM